MVGAMKEIFLRLKIASGEEIFLPNCTQILKEIPMGKWRRTLGGNAVYVGNSAKKYASEIQGIGSLPVGLSGVCQGEVVDLCSIQRVWHTCNGSEIFLDRPAVEESLLAIDALGKVVPVAHIEGSTVRLSIQSGESVRVSYCPKLRMHVTELLHQVQEWGGEEQWGLVLEE